MFFPADVMRSLHLEVQKLGLYQFFNSIRIFLSEQLCFDFIDKFLLVVVAQNFLHILINSEYGLIFAILNALLISMLFLPIFLENCEILAIAHEEKMNLLVYRSGLKDLVEFVLGKVGNCTKIPRHQLDNLDHCLLWNVDIRQIYNGNLPNLFVDCQQLFILFSNLHQGLGPHCFTPDQNRLIV